MPYMDFDWKVRYPSARSPVFGRRIVSTSHPAASYAGTRMLERGGNAVDAAIATAAALTVVEPVSCGLGSDAFAIVWHRGEMFGLNASGPAPRAWSPEYFAKQSDGSIPKRGWNSVTVPGAVGGWWELSKAFGCLPFADLLKPAIELAERGCPVAPIVQEKWAAQIPELLEQPGFRDAFMPQGRAPNVGEMIRFPEMASTLRAIASDGEDGFYRGRIAEILVAHSEAHGGAMTLEDLDSYKPEWVKPINTSYGGFDVHELPPNGQGIVALIAFAILREFDFSCLNPDSTQALHLQIEALKLAFAQSYAFVGDTPGMTVLSQKLLDAQYIRSLAARINPNSAQIHGVSMPPRGGTVYISAADDNGTMVSFIQSNFMGFGSGVVVPGTGVSLQNRGFGFSLYPEHPNCVAPGRRPFHTIIPGFLSANGDPVMTFGVMGGNMQPQGHVQTLVRMLTYRQHPQAACDAPRFKINGGLSVELESHISDQVRTALSGMGHVIESVSDSYMDFGSGQFICRMSRNISDGYVAASDGRRDGCAIAC
ncbi:MAG: gamma-glutamyltransferase family protein [Polaromonas sp.]|nr:gamma-glutamyltransferase family protein [Polaromonas sp.]